MKLASLVAVVVLLGAIVVLYLRDALLADDAVAISVQVLAVALMVWARVAFGLRSFHATANPTGGGLVTSGPYRFVRHPIYAAVILFLVAGLASHPSFRNAALVAVAIAASFVRMITEERLVTARYPEYAAYVARTKRIVPYVL